MTTHSDKNSVIDESCNGRLILVATPIGNMEDLSPRAIRTLREADLVFAEDTRVAGRLLAGFGFRKPLRSCFDANEDEQASLIADICLQGKVVALITTRGHPAISDPGFRVVKRAIEAGVPVSVIPGPCAAVSALSISGFPTDRFTFHGFLPRKGPGRKRVLDEILRGDTHVLYESPNRLVETLREIEAYCGNPFVSVTRELTKLHEETIRGSCTEVLTGFAGREIRGEITMVVRREPETEMRQNDDIPEEAMRAALALKNRLNYSDKDASEAVAAIHDLPKKLIYQALLRSAKS